MQSISDAVSAMPTDDAGKAVMLDYIKGIRENQQRTEERLTKTAGLLLSLAIACELLNQAAVSEFSLLGLRLTDLVLVRKLAPIGFAYLLYTHLSLIALRRSLLECHWHATRTVQPQIFENGLWRFLNPPSTFEIETIIETRTTGALKSAVSILSLPLMTATAVGPIIYALYAYIQLFVTFGLSDALLWFSALASASLTLQGCLVLASIGIINRE